MIPPRSRGCMTIATVFWSTISVGWTLSALREPATRVANCRSYLSRAEIVQTKPTTPELNGYRCSMAIAAALVAEWLDASTQSERFGLPHRRPRSAISDDGATTVRLGNYSVRAQSVRWCHIRTAGQGSSPRSQSGARPDDQDHTAPCKPDMAIANLNATAPEQISFYITAFSFDRRCLQSSITDGPAAGWPS